MFVSVCQYIATTKLKLFEKADMKDHQTEVMQDAVKLTKAFQAPDKEKKEKKKSGIAERRKTVAHLNNFHKKAQREGENLNLEKQFKIQFAQMGKLVQQSCARRIIMLTLFRSQQPEGREDKAVVDVGEARHDGHPAGPQTVLHRPSGQKKKQCWLLPGDLPVQWTWQLRQPWIR